MGGGGGKGGTTDYPTHIGSIIHTGCLGRCPQNRKCKKRGGAHMQSTMA